MKRNGEIDILRFIFAICIMGIHFEVLGNNLFPNAYIGVEFFFLLIGYFMAKRFSKNMLYEISSIPEISLRYIFSKVGRIYQYFLVAFSTNIVIQAVMNHWSVRMTLANTIRSLPDLSFTHLVLKTDDRLYITGSWFLSAMFISMMIVCPLYLLLRNWSSKVVFPISAIMIWGYILRGFNYQLTEVWGGVSAMWNSTRNCRYRVRNHSI